MHKILHKTCNDFSIRINPRKNTTHVANWGKKFFLQFPYTYIYLNFTKYGKIYSNNIHPIVAFSDKSLNQFDYFHESMYVLPILNTMQYGNVCLGEIAGTSLKELADKTVNYFFNKDSYDNYENTYAREYTSILKMPLSDIWEHWELYKEFTLPKVYTSKCKLINKNSINDYLNAHIRR